MMTCREIAELLQAYLEGELAEEYCVSICEHIRLCSPCLYFMESYKVTIRVGKQLPMVALPQHLVERLQAALKEINQAGEEETP